MKKLYACLFLGAISLQFTTKASVQKNPQIDSLEKVLATTHIDTEKVNILNTLSSKYNTSDVDKAIDYATKALQQAQSVHFKKGELSAYDNLGMAQFYKGNIKEAFTTCKLEYEQAKKAGNKYYMGQALFNQGYFYREEGDASSALQLYLQSLKIKEELEDSASLASTLLNIGVLYNDQGKYPLALSYEQKALAIFLRKGSLGSQANAYARIGNTYKDMEQDDKAIQCYQLSLKLFEKANHKRGIAIILNNLAGIYDSQKQSSLALNYYEKALKIRTEIGDKNGCSMILGNMGILYKEQGNLLLAKKYLERSMELAKSIGYKSMIENNYLSLSNLYVAQKNYKEAYMHHVGYFNTHDSIYNEKSAQQIAEMQTKYDSEKKEQEIVLLNKDKEVQKAKIGKQRTIMFSGIGAFILLALLTFFIYRNYQQKQKDNQLLEHKNQQITQQNKEILDSITYAKRIQQAILPPTDLIFSILKDSFIFYKPKDVVSGDFYGFVQRGNDVIITTADCTGHGVPGAFMSMIGSEQLTKIIIEKGITKPAEILDELHAGIRTALKQDTHGTENRDGMDIALCKINLADNKLEYAGANRPLWLINNGQLRHIKPDKQAIGGLHMDSRITFTNHSIALQKGDLLYTFTDGYADQFGGENDKKFMIKNFERLLLEIQHLPMKQQETILEERFNKWKGSYEQIDDVLVIGVRV